MSPNAEARPTLVKREGVSLSEATVALVSVEGAPDAVDSNFVHELGEAARSRDIVLVDAKAARYLVRGYLTANAAEGGADVEYVWDVFGPDKRRTFRLNDVVNVKGGGGDPWTIVTPAALAGIAAKSADDLAAFLSQSPEAKPVAFTAASAPASALGYAPLN